MSHFWLIESLADLRAYAARNNLPALAEHLDTAIQLAHLELSNQAANETHPPIKGCPPCPEDHRPEEHEPEDHGPEDQGSEESNPDDLGSEDDGR